MKGGFQAPPGFRESPQRPLRDGEVVASTYSIREELARTDTGIVFEARDMMLDRPVVLKLAWRNPGTPSLITEAKRCAAVRDPCSVAVYGMGQHNGVEYAVGERVTGALLRDQLKTQLTTDAYLNKLRTLIAAVARAHESGIAVGDISGATILVDPDGRMVLGRLSLSQIPAFGPLGQILAPEVVRGEVEAGDPAAAEAIDLYGLGCIAIEMARGTPPFHDASHDVMRRGHAYEPAPRLADLRPDLPPEVSDLVEWLFHKKPAARPRSALDVLAQIDAVTERLGKKGRTARVLVVDDDTSRARWLWSLARRAHPAAAVEISSEGTDAAHKLNRDLPDLVLVDAALKGVMNALELCMYARGLETEHAARIVMIGDVSERDRALFTEHGASITPDDADLANAVLEQVRAIATSTPRRRKPRSTVSG
jgi:CheY-like chemotaxis protein